MKELRAVVEREPRIAYAVLFGSVSRGTVHASSDIDVAIGLRAGASLTPLELGGLAADLERAAGRPVDLVLLDEAPPGLAYRIFRDGVTLVVRDPEALAARKARAILDYLDFQPVEAIVVRGVLTAARHGR